MPEVGEIKILGDQTARGLLGVTNSFVYKNIGFSFQVDGRFRGKFYSGTHRILNLAGLGTGTVINDHLKNFSYICRQRQLHGKHDRSNTAAILETCCRNREFGYQ